MQGPAAQDGRLQFGDEVRCPRSNMQAEWGLGGDGGQAVLAPLLRMMIVFLADPSPVSLAAGGGWRVPSRLEPR